MSKLSGKIALVTGAADGIGAASAKALAAEGAFVYVTDINIEKAQEVAEEIGDSAIALTLNVCEEADWNNVYQQIEKQNGSLHILVNNAGGGGAGDIEGTSIESYRKGMTLNVDSVYMGIKLGLPLMQGNDASIINMSSIHGLRAASYAVTYTTAKGAVTMLTKAIARHCADNRLKVRCNSLHPGYVKTPQMLAWIDSQEDSEAALEGLVSQHPIGFLGEPEDIASGVVFLASNDSRFMTGAELVIDGGFCL
ncbi:SDR family oxidoreductase [Alteromonas confluentis]|uniref:Short-chain dehydrogenase n=1 Tax=Alteromonas confluentis TaxID=1656094 RepID=A0A1E7Z9M0_9ALTE|nr:SDR family oxidoreductase [Alteromonas confluentis]OFC70243.1 hypothetical protein BFC18_13760 [Alteromonas confluentis]